VSGLEVQGVGVGCGKISEGCRVWGVGCGVWGVDVEVELMRLEYIRVWG
jgi:hypothetical protein